MGDRTKRRTAGPKAKPAKPATSGGNGAGPSGRATRGRRSSGVRRERLVVRRFDAGTVFKLSLLFYLSVSCVVLVAAMLLWAVATVTGVRGNVEKFIGDLVVAEDFELIGSKMLQMGAVLSLVLVVLGTAANLVAATLYNLISDMIGGVSVVVESGRSQPAAGPPTASDAGVVDGTERGFVPARPSASDGAPARRTTTQP